MKMHNLYQTLSFNWSPNIINPALRMATLLGLLVLTSSLNTLQAQLTGVKNIPGDYPTLDAAIADLNIQGVGPGGVTFNVLAGNPQTAPAGGYVIGNTGSAILSGPNATSAANQVIIQGNGNTVTASAAHTPGNLNDAIFKLIGADWITIQGFTMQENPVNLITAAATNNMTEWGVALLYVTTTDGAQNNTIQSNTITLNRIYQNTFGVYSNSTHSATAVTVSATATTASGGNHNLIVRMNNISNVNIGVVVVGPTAAADHNQIIVIGGSIAGQGNTITNYGTTGTFSGYANVSGTVNGILVRNSVNYTISRNTVESSNGGTIAGTLRGIYMPAFSVAPTGTLTNTISNNNISLRSAVATASMQGISVESTAGNATTTLNIDNNNFYNFSHTIASSGVINFIINTSIALNNSISNNTFTNNTVNTTGSVTFISNSWTAPANGVKNVNNNAIVTAFSKTGAGGTVTFFLDNGSDPVTATNNTNNNTFSNIIVTGATSVTGISNTNGGSPIKSVLNNLVSNISGGTGTFFGITTSFDGGSTTITGNTVNNITNGGTTTGISLGSGSGTTNMSQNTIHTMTGTGTGTVSGILVTGGTTRNIFKNKIYNLQSINAAGVVFGISVTGGLTININNNLIGDLRAPITSSATDAVRGISITAATALSTMNIYFNTIYLNAQSTGANFSTSGVFHTASATATTATLDLRNNIIVNNSTPIGTGTAVALRRSLATLSNYATTSNNNLFWAGGAGCSQRFIYHDGTAGYQMAAFQALVAPRESASVTEDPPFLSTVGSSPSFLHINPAVPTQVESGGMTIGSITDDFDGNLRAATPDIGADEFAGIMDVACAGQPNSGTATAASPICAGQSSMICLSGQTGPTGITFQWQSSTMSGGPYTDIACANGSCYNTGTLTAGTYYYVAVVTCTNSGLSATSNQVTIVVNPNPIAAVMPTSSIVCQGTPVILTASGGTTYMWSPATGLNMTTGAMVTATPASTTTYTVTVSDINGCSTTASSTVTILPLPVFTVSATPASICSGGTSQLQANVTSTTVNFYSYSAGTGTTLDPMTGSTQVINASNDDTPTAAPAPIGFTFPYEGTNYTQYSVSPDGWILLGGAVAVSQFTNVTTSPTNIPKIYPYWDDLATGTDGNVKVLVTGTAPNRIFIVQWFVTVPRNTTGPANSTFQAWLYETSGKIEFRYGTMGVPNSGTISGGLTGATATNFNSITFSTNTNSTTVPNDVNTIAPPTGTIYTFMPPAFTYAWSPATYLNNTTIANPLASGVTSTITYTVTVTSSNSCSSTASVTVTASPVITITETDMSGVANDDSIICPGGSATLTASGGNMYMWSSGDNTAATTVSPATTTTYTVTVSDAAGCSATATATITVSPAPAASIAITETSGTTNNDGAICQGASATLTASGGTSYVWSTMETTPSITVSMAGTYTVTVTDGSSCTATATATITVNQLPTPVITATPNDTVCSPQNITLNAGAGYTGYVWTNMATSQSITVSMSDTYGVTVTDASGCTGFSSATVVVNQSPVPSETHVNPTTCFSTDGSIDLTVTPAAMYSYNWTSPTGMGIVQGQQDQLALTVGTYTVLVTNPMTMCSSSLTVQLTVPGGCGGCAPPTSVTVMPNPICSGQTATFTANGTLPGATFAWFNAPQGGMQVGTGNPLVSGPLTQTTTYCVEQTIIVPNDVMFSYTGAPQTFTVPAGVTSISITALGAQGGGSGTNGTGGGLGGSASGNLVVSPGQILNIYVGGQGGLGFDGGIGGFNGGGIGGQSLTGGGGGGASDIRVGGVALTNRVIVAGGGGGAGGSSVGGLSGGLGGGTTGGNGAPIGAGTGAAGGNQVMGGFGGFGGGGADGLPGVLGIGGGGGNAAKGAGGGGGGGGLYGGGGGEAGGSSGGSGAGGSGYIGGVTGGSTSQGSRSGDGLVTFSYLGPCTSTRTCGTANVEVTPPTINCPPNVTVQCSSNVPPVNTQSVTASDNNGVPTVTFVSDVTTNQSCANRFTITRTYRATDFCNNSSTCSQTITVFDNTAPSITCPAAVTVQCAAQVPGVNPALATATDNCGGGVPTVSFVSDVTTNQSCANRFTITRTYRATDNCGNSSTCSQTITVFDNTPPSITCPAAVTVQCAAQVPGVNPALATATDNCGGGVPMVSFVSDVTTNQSCFNRFTLTRTYRATDPCGNSATCSQTITVFDNTPPTFTCPAAVTVQCANQVPAPSTTIIAMDNCTGPAPTVAFVSDVTTNQTCFNRFTLTRTYRATDACGNSATCAQTITVFDNTAPTITCPANVTVQCASLVPAVNLSLPTTDNCGGPAPTISLVSNVTTNQTCVNRFVLTRTYRATDACGNSTTCAQVITVFDNTPPVITFTDPLLVGVPNNGTVQVQCFGQDPNWSPPSFSQGSVMVTDNCTGGVTVAYNETFLDGGDCADDGYINRYSLMWTATDACGNSSSRTIFVELIDTIPPVILGVPENITVNCDEIPELPDNVTATDECLCACVMEFNQTDPLPGCQDGQVIVRSWTAVDDCGNETVETQNITLIDDEGPVLQIIHPDLVGTPDGTVFDYSCSEGIPGFFDELNVQSVTALPSCGGPAMIKFTSSNIETRNCRFFGFMEQTIYQWTALDQCGNETTFTITAQLVDDEPPVLLGVPDMACIGDPALDEIEAVDNCDQGVFIYYEVTIPNTCGTGTAIRRVYQAFDPCGNTAEDTVVLITNDNNAPGMIFTNPDLAGLDPGEILIVDCNANFGLADVSVDDDCPGMVLSFDERVLENGDCSTNGVLSSLQLTWTATDMCGNSAQLIATVNVVDQTAPVFTNTDPEITIGCNDALPENIATDNCGEVVMTTVDNIIPGDCIYEYDVVRQVTATDPCGNTTTLLQTIHVGDGSGPIIEGVESVICDDLSIPDVTAWDPCAEEFVEVIMTEEILNVPCSDGVVMERTWTATDICGNVSVATQTFIVDDQTPPEIQIPSNSIIRRYMDNLYNLVFLSQTGLIERLDDLDAGSISVFDDCGEELIPEFTLDVTFSDDCEADGYFERRTYSWVVSDICGNEASVSFTVDIMDDVPPVLSGVPADETVICEELPVAPSIQVEDPAQPVTIIYSEQIVDGVNPGEFMVTRLWTATDACGNSSSASQSILWIPDTFLDCNILLPGVVDCNSFDVIVTSAITGGLGALTFEWEIEGEKCFIQSGQGTPEISIYIGFSAVDISLTVTDEFGCTTVCQATLDCIDPFDDQLTELPVIHTPNQYNGDIHTPVEVISSAPKDNLQQLNLWPNPANESLHLSFETTREGEVEFSFMNLLGQIVLVEKMKAQKGFNTQKIDVSKISEGGYLLQVNAWDEKHTKMIVIMRND